MRLKVLLFVSFRFAPRYKKRSLIFFLFFIAPLPKNHIFQFLAFRSYRVGIWCSGVLATLRCLHKKKTLYKLRFASGLFFIPHLVSSVPPHRFAWHRFATSGKPSLPHSAYLSAPLLGADFRFICSASAPLLPDFKGFHFHFRGLVPPLRSAHAPTGIPSAHTRGSSSPHSNSHPLALTGALTTRTNPEVHSLPNAFIPYSAPLHIV